MGIALTVLACVYCYRRNNGRDRARERSDDDADVPESVFDKLKSFCSYDLRSRDKRGEMISRFFNP